MRTQAPWFAKMGMDSGNALNQNSYWGDRGSGDDGTHLESDGDAMMERLALWARSSSHNNGRELLNKRLANHIAEHKIDNTIQLLRAHVETYNDHLTTMIRKGS